MLLVAALALLGDTFKLYLKDGGYHLVREYQVQGDRVRYYSIERGDWEEIPNELLDLKKTEAERKGKVEQLKEQSRAEAEEEQAERELRKEIAAIPMNSGAYFKRANKVEALPQSDYQVITDKKRKVLQVLSPIPLVPGKASVVIKGERATFTVTEERPEFYLRLAQEERFGIVSLTPKKNVRVVENISILPVVKQAEESRKQMATFEQDLGNGLYKIWPEKPLPPGEYALVEFAGSQDATDIQLLIWDFARIPQSN
ncbi:MAG TPA: hypothetical protein VK604_14095 [Bryobacteraceae bacterium]|nr:hypothetical protein [Bryobacteraceae bacterium]